MPVFFNKKEPKTVKAYNLEDCPDPKEDWTEEKPDYSSASAAKTVTKTEDK